ncbi:MAG: hypothetical protein ACRDOL_40630 [Streptosporangiaceae bacterium]
MKCFKLPILTVWTRTARRLAREVAALELRRRYLDLKVRYWSAREAGDLDKAAAVAEELAPVIRRMNPKDNP